MNTFLIAPGLYKVLRVITTPTPGQYDVTGCYEKIGTFKASSAEEAAYIARTQGYKGSEGYKEECKRVTRRMKEGWR